jgi:hypothetical protein
VVSVAADQGYIDQRDIARLLSFRDNPVDKSWITSKS